MENGSPSTEDSTKPSEPEKKDQDVFISLRPGGGLSLRPGGGFGSLGISKGTQSTTSVPSTRPFRSSSGSETSLPPVDLGGKDFGVTASLIKSSKEELLEDDRPDGCQTNVEKLQYNRQYLFQFQAANTDLPENLQFSFLELPELQRDLGNVRISLSKGTKTQPPNVRIQTGQRQPTKGSTPPIQPKGQNQQALPRRAKDRWEPRPSFLKDEKDQVLRSITGVLNKITPEKFEKLTRKLCDEIGSIVEEDVYAEAVSLVFSKAVSEPNFSKMYADLCVKLNAQPVVLPDQKVTFRRVLLNKCQEEFESTYISDNKDLPEDPEERIIFKEKARRRKLGNVKFIGELFKSKLLSERIIEECIRILFDSVGKSRADKETMEHHCELVCKLLSTIGKLLDTAKAKPFMQSYFDQFARLAQDDSLSSRIRFMFQDLLELRKNSWVPRREENTPKTIGEVHAEALAKQFQDELEIAPTKSIVQSDTKAKPSQPVLDKKEPAKKKTKKGKKKEAPKKLTEEELEKRTHLLLEEYLADGDAKEAEQCVKDLNAPNHHAKVIEQAIMLSFDKHEKERNLVSKLFSELSPEVFSDQDFVKAFKQLIEIVDDLDIDIPSASKMLGQFIGRAVVDNCLSLSTVEKELKKEKVKEAVIQVIHSK